MHLMSEVMAHTITLHLLDAPGRVHRFLRKHPDLAERVPEEGARLLPQPVGRDALAPEARRQDLTAPGPLARRGARPIVPQTAAHAGPEEGSMLDENLVFHKTEAGAAGDGVAPPTACRRSCAAP